MYILESGSPSIARGEKALVVDGFFCAIKPMNVKTTLFLLLLSLSFGYAQQQTGTREVAYPKRIISRYELMIGLNFISGTGSDFLEQQRISKWGFRGSLGLIHTFNSHWELDAKISYENKGYRFRNYSDNPGPPATDELVENLSLNYVTFTLLPRYRLYVTES